MEKRDVLSVALKVLGIYFILATIPAWSQVIAYAADSDLGGQVSWTAMSVAQLFVAGISVALLLWSDHIADVFCRPAARSEAGPPADLHGLQEAAFSVLGLYLLLRSITTIGAIVANRAWFEVPGAAVGPWWRSLLGPCAELAVGAWLFLGSRRIVAWWKRAHDAGHS